MQRAEHDLGAEPAAAVALQIEGRRFSTSRDKGLFEEEEKAFEQSLYSLWPVLTFWSQALLMKKLSGAYVVFAHRQWFALYSEIVSVLGLVLLLPLTIM